MVYLPSCCIADDLVFMVMVCSSDGHIIVNSGK